MVLRIEKNEETMFNLILIDLMFLPYLFHLPIKLSMFPLAIWVLCGKKEFNTKNGTLILFLITGIFSILIGLIKNTDFSVIVTNIQALVIIMYGFLIYNYTLYVKKYYDIDITNILLIFLTVASAFMVMYWVKPTLFFEIRPFWTVQSSGEVFRSYQSNRFSFFISEPNNFAALISAMMGYLLFGRTLTKIEKFVVICISCSLVISTASISGTIYTIVLIIAYFIWGRQYDNHSKEPTRGFRNFFMKLGFVIVSIMIIVLIANFNKILNSSLITNVFDRYDLYFGEGESDLSGARSEIWSRYIKEHNILQYLLVGDASVGKPHSGHLFIIYAFGVISYITFLKSFVFDYLRDKQALVVRFIFLAVFSINTLIVDLRAFTLFTVLLGITAAKMYENNEER